MDEGNPAPLTLVHHCLRCPPGSCRTATYHLERLKRLSSGLTKGFGDGRAVEALIRLETERLDLVELFEEK
jgi:hypothetical protein